MKNYFSHDEGARNDPKLIKVLMKLGQAGKGVYWDLIEMLYEQNGYLSITECDSIAYALRVDCELLKSLITEFDLFKNDGDRFWSNSVLSRLGMRNEKSKKASESAYKRWENANAMRTQCDGNAIKERKVNEIKGKDSIGIKPTPDFEIQLTSTNIGAAIEYIRLTKQQEATPELILSLFTVFKQKNFTGAKFYQNSGEIISHFFESLKFVKLELNGNKSNAKYNPREAGAKQLLEKGKLFVATRGAANTGS